MFRISGRWRGVVGVLIAVIAVGAGLLYLHHRHSDDEVVATDPSGSPPKISGPLAGMPMAMPPPDYQGPPVVGFVRAAGGQPIAGARVTLATERSYVRLALGGEHPADLSGNAAVTSSDGRFEISPDARPRSLVVRCPEGFAFVAPSSLASGQNIVVQPWGRVEGTASFGAKPAALARLYFQTDRQFAIARIFLDPHVQTDQAGHFSIEFVPPGKLTFGVWTPGGRFIPRLCEIDVASGATSSVRIGGNGRPVVGRVTPSPEAMNYRRILLRSSQTVPQHDQITTDINPDGTFRMDDVPPGTYALSVQCGISDARSLEIVGTVESSLTVPSIGGGYRDEPFDIGVVPLKMNKSYVLGQSAPHLSGVDASGKAVKLSEFAGSYALFSITADVSGKSWSEIVRMRAIHDRFSDAKLVMLLFYAGNAFAEASQAASQAGVRWRLVHLDSAINDLPEPYRGAAHPGFLIDPQGKFIATNLDGQRAYGAADLVLSPHEAPRGGLTIRVDHLAPEQASATAPYTTVPPPASDDAATGAKISVVDGQLPQGPDPVHCLNDGQMPTDEDQPARNFRFAMGTLEGRVRFDLGRSILIAQINSYSWHSDSRAPQLYQVFGSNGDSAGFDLAPKIGIDPAQCGWTKIADVDTRPKTGLPGGRYAVSISSSSGSIGTYRYLLFVMFPTESDDDSGHTFYSEIDVIQKK
jgi:hypothetical protein